MPTPNRNPIQNSPENLTMVDVLGITNQFGGPVKSCRFIVRITPQGPALIRSSNMNLVRQLSYMCEAAEMPGRGFQNYDGRYYGPNFKIPFQSQYEDTSMTFICRKESLERTFFDNWMEIINPQQTWNFSYRDDYASTIDIYQLTDIPKNERAGVGPYKPGDPIATYQWSFHNAYPVVINPQQVTWADDNFQRLTVTFTYTHWSRPNIDRQARSIQNENDFIKGSEVTNLPSVKLL